MKLRIQGNSVRLRLSQSDLDSFSEEGHVRETLHFPGGRRLVYLLRASDQVQHLAARFDGALLSVLLPASWSASWADSDRVGFEGTELLDDGSELHLLVEKDFECLHKDAEDEPDAFPHPRAE